MVSESTSVVSAILRGDAILLTGAGFSCSLRDRDGDHLPVGTQLAKSLWPIAFGSEEYDGTALAYVYEAAKNTSPTLLKEQLKRHFEVNRESIPDRYKTWFSLPWHRIYTLNIDDADEAISEMSAEVDLQVLSALNSMPGDVDPQRLSVVHINGRLRDFPGVTFSQWDFADRTAFPDAWYQEFSTDIATRPVVVVGSAIEEPPLWHFMQLRERRGQAKEMRPRSWLVTPQLDLGHKRMLQDLNFAHLKQTEEEFFQQTIAPREKELLKSERIAQNSGQDHLLSVAEEIRDATPGSADYLMGSSPTWGDVTNGFAANFEFDEALDKAIDGRSEGIISVTGSAGSGKSTSLMKAAARLSAKGNSVYWLGRESEGSIRDIRRAVRENKPDYLFIDDVDRFTGEAKTLLSGLQRDNEALVVVIASRSIRSYVLQYDSLLSIDFSLEQTRLSDKDADALLEQLSRGKRLGALRSLTHKERIEILTRRHDRQLLVTLIEATSGVNFHDKVAQECRDLPEIEQTLYGIACTAVWADNKPLSTQNLLSAAGLSNPNEALFGLRRLGDSGLLKKVTNGHLVRHRVVAESAINYFRNAGLIASWVTDLIILAAQHYEIGNARRSRLGRMLIRLISHNNMRDLVADNDAVSRIYGNTEVWLDRDFHFWLQRGSYELDYGDLAKAENFLRQAKALADGDVLVETAWAQLQFKRALSDPVTPQANTRAEEALEILYSIMRRPENESPHTFAVFLIYGLRWLKEANMGREDERQLREMLAHYGLMGSLQHARKREVLESWDSAQRWMTANPLR